MVQILDLCDQPTEAASQRTYDEIGHATFQDPNLRSIHRHRHEWTANEPCFVIFLMTTAHVNQWRGQ
jgi:hypothetical protein